MKAIIIVSISSLFYIYEFFLRVMPSVITDALMQEFQISAGWMSMMTSSFLYAYAAMQIPAGLLVDRLGPRKALTFAVLICALATAWFQASHHLGSAMMARALLGMASSVAFIAPLTLASRWFAPKHLALVAGCVQLLGCLGAIMGGAPIVALQAILGWRQTLYWAAWVGIGLAGLFWLMLKDYPPGAEKQMVNFDLQKQFFLTINNRQNLWIAVTAFSSWAAMGSLAELWGVPFLIRFHGLDAHHAALLILVVWIGVAVGSPAAGAMTEWSRSKTKLLFWLLLLSCLTTMILLYAQGLPFPLVLLNLFLMGFASGAQPITFSLIAENNPPERIGTAFGFNNMAVVCGASLLQPAIGGLLDVFWEGEISNMRIYSLLTYQKALTLIPLSILLGMLVTHYCLRDRR